MNQVRLGVVDVIATRADLERYAYAFSEFLNVTI